MSVPCWRFTMGDNYCKQLAPLFIKPARDLTQAEAFAVLSHLQSIGEIGLYDPKQSATAPRGQMRVATKMAGVEYWQASGNNGASTLGSVGAHKKDDFYPTPQFAVVLYRLAARLKDLWGATKIVWGGVGQGSGKNPVDCHMKGHCIDFYGATTSLGGVFDVKRDWYLRPVYLKDGTVHAANTKTGFDYDRWGHDTQTSYRLLTSKDEPPKLPADKDYFNPLAKDFFLDVYSFVAEECAFGSNDISPAAFKGGHKMKAGFTIHPDYPTGLRFYHMDHMHFQLGQAFA